MIAKLRGLIDSIEDGQIVVDIQGVGYLVQCSSRTIAGLPGMGKPVTLLIETVVREDDIRLFGFENAEEREWFRLLQTVQAVGARVALAIMATMSVSDLAEAIMAQDKASLTRAPGVGPRLADRILSELKNKVPTLDVRPGAAQSGDSGKGAQGDAISALVNLGYRRAEAFGAISTASKSLGDEAPIDALITAGLKELAQ